MTNLFIYFSFISILDLKQELKIRNIAIPKKVDSGDGGEEPMDTSISPPKNRLSTRGVSRLNDINDSRNNNNSSSSFLDKSSLTSKTFNNSSLNDTTILNNNNNNTSLDTSMMSNHNDPSNILKSHMNAENLNKSSQPTNSTILKCKLLKLLTCWRVED